MANNNFNINNLNSSQLNCLKKIQESYKNEAPIFDKDMILSANIFENDIKNLINSQNETLEYINRQIQASGINSEDLFGLLDKNQDNKIDEEELLAIKQENNDDEITLEDIEEYINTITSENIQNETTEKQTEYFSIQYLNEITQNYTQRTDLTEEEIGEIITINQMENIFNNLYSKYTEELNSEGAIDDIYNALKKFTGLGITRQMIEDEFNSHFNTTKILTSYINKDYSACDEILKQEFIRKVNTESNGNIVKQFEIFQNYFKDENEAIEKFNLFTKSAKGFNNPDVTTAKDENGNVVFTIGSNEPITVDEMGDIEGNGFLYLQYKIDENIIPDDGYYDTTISTNFNELYNFLTGSEYNFKNIIKYIETSYQYSFANSGYITAQDMQENLSNKGLSAVIEEFETLNNNDLISACEQFNTYYNSLLSAEDTKNTIPKDIFNQGEIIGIQAKINDDNELEYIINVEPYEDNCYLLDLYGKKDKTSNNYTITFNPSKLNSLYENGQYEEFQKQNELSLLLENKIYEINQFVNLNNILTARYENEFNSSNNTTLEELSINYQNSYSEAFGESRLQNILSEYTSDMESYSDKLTAAISIGAIGLSFVCPAFGYVAMASAGIDNTIDAINMATNKQKDDWGLWLEETSREIALITIGMGIGYKASKIGESTKNFLQNHNISLKNSSIGGTIAETVSDLALGGGFDYITIGSINLEGNGLSAIIDIISGIRGYKAVVSSKKYKAYLEQQKAIRENELEIKYAEKTLDEAINKEIKAGKIPDPKRIETAKEIIYGKKSDTQIREFAGQLAKEFSSDDYALKTLEQIKRELGYTEQKQITVINGTYKTETKDATFSARTKSEKSTYSKLRNKLLELKIELPKSAEDAKEFIGDSQGIVIVIQSKPLLDETIKGLEITKTAFQNDEDINLFINYLKGQTANIPENKKIAFEEIKPLVARDLSEAQSEYFVNNLVQAVEEGRIVISEINNYSGTNGIPYLSAAQISEIQAAYSKWYENTYEIAKNKQTPYEIRLDEHNIEYIYDCEAHTKFYREIPVKSSAINNKGVKEIGYTAVQFNFVNSFHQNSELQFKGTEINDISNCEHIIYDIIKDKKTTSSPVYDGTKQVVRKIQTIDHANNNLELMTEFNQYYTDVFIAARYRELGITAQIPSIKEYPKLSAYLTRKELYTISIEGVTKLHNKIRKQEKK